MRSIWRPAASHCWRSRSIAAAPPSRQSARTVARYLRRLRRRGDPAKRWLAFLADHREVIAAFDFFTVPTLTFHLLYCFFIVEHGRRRVLHFNITRHPTAEWVVQQLREA